MWDPLIKNGSIGDGATAHNPSDHHRVVFKDATYKTDVLALLKSTEKIKSNSV